MKLVDDWKAVWKHYSTIALGMAGSLQGVWAGLPDSVRDDLPRSFGQGVAWITVAVAALGLVGKFIDQTPKDEP